jgi:hypothetical protein
VKEYRAALARGVDSDHITAGAKRYADERRGEPAKFTKLPATWLRKGCYDDQPDPEPPPGADGEYHPYQNPIDDSVYDEKW